MATGDVEELGANLGKWLARVRSGAELLVMERGRPVARIGPVTLTDDEHLAELERAGLVKIGTGISDEFLDAPRPGAAGGGSVLEALLEERREGR